MSPHLNDRVQSLPPELFNWIRTLVFTAPNSKKIHLDRNSVPPAQLRVSRLSRKSFASQYYSANTFIFGDADVMCSWLKSLTKDHRLQLTAVRLCNFDLLRKSGMKSSAHDAVGERIARANRRRQVRHYAELKMQRLGIRFGKLRVCKLVEDSAEMISILDSD